MKYGEKEPNTLLIGTATKFVDGGDAKHTQYIHRVGFNWIFCYVVMEVGGRSFDEVRFDPPLNLIQLIAGDFKRLETKDTICLSLWQYLGMVV